MRNRIGDMWPRIRTHPPLADAPCLTKHGEERHFPARLLPPNHRATSGACTNALRAARAELQRIQRGLATFTLATGRPDLFPEIPVTVQGFKPEIDATHWLITLATHRLDSSGLITTLDMELKIDEQ